LFQRTGGAPRLIGGCGIAESPEGALEIGCWIARPFWGLGYATEAARHVMKIARSLGLPPLTACHFVDNPASGRVLRKAGFRPTGAIVRRPCRARGGLVDAAAFVEDRSAGADDSLAEPDDMVREGWRLMAA
jgi:RimJ/RimL family protein N-acetyltransferase